MKEEREICVKIRVRRVNSAYLIYERQKSSLVIGKDVKEGRISVTIRGEVSE